MAKRIKDGQLQAISPLERALLADPSTKSVVVGGPPTFPPQPQSLANIKVNAIEAADEARTANQLVENFRLPPVGQMVEEGARALLPGNALLTDLAVKGFEKVKDVALGSPSQRAARSFTGPGSRPLDTKLPPFKDSTREADFQTKYRTMAVEMGLDTNPDSKLHFYDYRRAYEAGALNTKGGHFPSEFKLPGHPRTIVDGMDTRTGRTVKRVQDTKRRFK